MASSRRSSLESADDNAGAGGRAGRQGGPAWDNVSSVGKTEPIVAQSTTIMLPTSLPEAQAVDEVTLTSQLILQEPFKCMAVGHDGTVWTGERNGSILLRDPATGHPEADGIVHERGSSAVSSLAFVRSTSQVWAGFANGALRVFDSADKTCAAEMRQHASAVHVIHPSGAVVYTGDGEGDIFKWTPAPGRPNPPASLTGGHGSACVRCMASDEARGLLYSGSDDGVILAWEGAAANPSSTALQAHSSAVLSLCLLPGAHRLWSGGEDSTVCIWDTQTNTLTTRLSGAALHRSSVTHLFYPPDDGKVWSADSQGVIILWDPVTTTVVQKLSPSEGGAWQQNAIVAALPLPRRVQCKVWTCSADGAVRIWNANAQCPSDNHLVEKLRREIDSLKATRPAVLQAAAHDRPPHEPDESDMWVGEVDELRARLREKDGELRAAQDELEEALQALGEKDLDSRGLREFLALKKAEMNARIDEEAAARAEAERQAADLRAELAVATQGVHTHTDHHHQHGLAGGLGYARDERRAFVEVEVDRIKAALTQANRLRIAAEDELDSLRVVREHRDCLLEEIASLEQQLHTSQAQAAHWKERWGEAQGQLAGAEAAAKEHERAALAAQRELHGLGAAVGDGCDREAALRAVIEQGQKELDAERDHADAMQLAFAELEQTLAAEHDRTASLNYQFEQRARIIDELEHKLTSSLDQTAACKKEVVMTTAELEAAKRALSDLQQQLETSEYRLGVAAAEREQVEVRLAASEAAAAGLKRETDAIKGPWQQLQAVLADSEQTLHAVQQQFREDIATLEEEIKQRDATIAQQRKALIEKDSTIAVQRGQLGALQNRHIGHPFLVSPH
ncbi:Vegetative incompatibility protein HET-E-1 [Diplonema papillatum]|nr:Vegetative incompatibility protein HET-E-1 [Diplonema papillatum]